MKLTDIPKGLAQAARETGFNPENLTYLHFLGKGYELAKEAIDDLGLTAAEGCGDIAESLSGEGTPVGFAYRWTVEEAKKRAEGGNTKTAFNAATDGPDFEDDVCPCPPSCPLCEAERKITSANGAPSTQVGSARVVIEGVESAVEGLGDVVTAWVRGFIASDPDRAAAAVDGKAKITIEFEPVA